MANWLSSGKGNIIGKEGEGVITPERAAKGDLVVGVNSKGVLDRAESQLRFVIDDLIEKEVLEDYHKAYGFSLLELRSAFFAPWKARSASILLGQWGVGVSIGKAAEIYSQVRRRLLGKGEEVVIYAMETMLGGGEKRGSILLGKYALGVYQEHFGRLVIVMDEERDNAFG